jgi:hypothetical protein
VQRAWELGYDELRPQLLLTEALFVGFPHFRAWQQWLLQHPTPEVLAGGALGASVLDYDVIADTASLHVPALTPAVLRACRVLPQPGGPIALLRHLGAADAHPSRPQVADVQLILGELSQSLDPRICTLRDSIRSELAPLPGTSDPFGLLS